MRTIILSLVTTILVINSANAQKIKIGLKAGPHISSFLFGSDDANTNSSYFQKYGFHGGLLADFVFQPTFSIQPQLLFALKGGKLPSGAGFDFNTVDLPINFLYHHEGFFAGAGPNFSYLLSGKIRTTSGETADLFKDEDITDAIKVKRLEIGINTLLGYEFPGGFLLSANYAGGINQIFENISGAGPEFKTHNSYFGFSLGYIFPGNKK